MQKSNDFPPRNVTPRAAAGGETRSEPESIWHFDAVLGPVPRTHLLSNGDYSVMLTAAGSGYSRWRDVAVIRWREDATRDPWGSYIFLRDVADGEVWSAGYLPVGREPDDYRVSFAEGSAHFTRTDGPISTTTEVLVAAGHDAEVRRISVTNNDTRVRRIELTTYTEAVIATPDSDAVHPAFSKMFVQTEFVSASETLLATRRNRDPHDPRLWVFHVSALEGEAIGGLQFETDRARFLERGHELRDAVAIMDARPLSNSSGTVLDPVLSLRRRIRVAPGETVSVAFWTGIAHSRSQAIAIAEELRDPAAFAREKTAAAARAQDTLRELEVQPGQARHYQQLANRLIYADAALRAPADILARNRLGPKALWPLGLSGDRPIVLLNVGAQDNLPLVEELLHAFSFWRSKRFDVDVVVLCDAEPSAGLRAALLAGPKPGVFLLCGPELEAGVRDLLLCAARSLLHAERGTLYEQMLAAEPIDIPDLTRVPRRGKIARESIAAEESPGTNRALPMLEFFNGLGGFAAGGREYVTVLEEGQWTPAPWVNVIANANFGCLVSADGSGSTWSLNAQQNQITPWSNDPVSDSPSEVIYVRDNDSGVLWSATPLPIRQPNSTYVVRHGFGYSRIEHLSHGIALDLLHFVPLEDSIKISRLKIANRTANTRHLGVTQYLEWVLGQQRGRNAPFIVTSAGVGGTLFARNAWNSGFAGRVAFMAVRGGYDSCTADRREFVGRNGVLSAPAALTSGQALSGRCGGGFDPCGALQRELTLAPGEEVELVFLLGECASQEAAAALRARYESLDLDAALKAVGDHWDLTLGVVQVKTPDRSMDLLLNGWLLYQTLSARVWGRTAFYQSSGAYGYRDQLQDVMALCLSRPELTREHILRAAARQFQAGDVQHWWLPTSGEGIQTRIADDRVWLPYVVAHYVETTGDVAVLDETVPFLQGGELPPGQMESFAAPAATQTTATLFEHCALALDSSLTIGSHGLPLFGTGDWNDGMNRVGIGGKGESVWLGWFLHSALLRFALLAERRVEVPRAVLWRKHAFSLSQAIEREGWDGDWYRRGYYDDGTPLGSVASDECRIDSVAQSWAVISEGAKPSHAARAMAAVNSQLVSRSDGLVQLFTPAFDKTAHDPGYIKAYPPGLRENGGQYTHAAMWCVLAFAQLGDGDRAQELFSLLNPINHSSTRAGIHRYKVEPYVVCADVYSAPPHVGRGGWTWYTGSAAWMYRAAIEGILGIKLRGSTLHIFPCVPRSWGNFEYTYKHGASRYHIAIDNPRGVARGIAKASLDGQDLPLDKDCQIALVDDGSYHYARIIMG